MHVRLLETDVQLTAEGAVYLSDEKALLIADVHWGRVGYMRAEGIALPQQAALHELNRLKQLIAQYKPLRVFFLGDLFHAKPHAEWALLTTYLQETQDVDFVLVAGNHDRDFLASTKAKKALTIVARYTLGQLLLTHHPTEPDPQHVNVCGHTHPGVRLSVAPRKKQRMRCFFWQAEKRLTLPAFSPWAGTHLVKPEANDRLVALYEGHLLPLFSVEEAGDSFLIS